jgi:hypothetical protein
MYSVEKRKDGPEFDQVLEMVRTINNLTWRFAAPRMITENHTPISGSRIVCLQP